MTHPGPLAQLPSPEDETDPTAESDPAEELAPEQLRPRRWPLLVLLVGALGLVALFEGVAPKERAVTLRFSDPKTVRAVELVWRDHDGDMLASTRWAFDGVAGHPATRTTAQAYAPGRLATRVRARRGEVRAALTIERSDGSVEHRDETVRFAGDEETVLSVP